RLALVVALAGCGRFGFDARAGSDAPLDGAHDAASDGAIGSAQCGGIDLLADTFTANVPSPQWYSYKNGGITTVQMGGQLVITLPATTIASAAYGGFGSVFRYDVRGQRIAVEVPQTASTATTAQTDIQLVSVKGDILSIIEESGQLTASQYINGTGTNLTMIPYNVGADRWWAFREDAGTLAFETSPDGVTFTLFSSIPTPAFASLVSFALETGTFETVMNGGAGHFDNVNGGTPSGKFCPASTLRDDFNSGVIDDRWAGQFTSGTCTYGESNGHVTIALDTAGGEECALRSATGFDLTNDAVFTEVVSAPGLAQTYTVLRASQQNGDNVELSIAGTTLDCAQIINSSYSTSCSIPYDAVAHRFLRLRGSAGMIAWETSPDGMTWTTRAQVASPIALDAVFLTIAAGTNGAPAMASQAVFGTFDVLPP
ncbi:MAG: hypothetical protein JO257_30550, partial [Deltaproteobacteria bacterium]|nr:hypothetical protein [Deltaproteobacteria bacterium]